MSDKELLELAAKAAGYEWDAGVAEYRAAQTPPLIALWIPMASTAWNPLEDDGHALRLAVKLRMSIEISAHEESTYAYADDVPRTNSCVNWSRVRGDEAPATRRAIVQAAAEIGKALP